MLKRGYWSEEEDDRIRREYPTTNTGKLAEQMRRAKGLLKRRASALGVKKSPHYLRAIRTDAARSGKPVAVERSENPARHFGEHALPDWVLGVRRHFIADDEEELETMGGGDSVLS